MIHNYFDRQPIQHCSNCGDIECLEPSRIYGGGAYQCKHKNYIKVTAAVWFPWESYRYNDQGKLIKLVPTYSSASSSTLTISLDTSTSTFTSSSVLYWDV